MKVGTLHRFTIPIPMKMQLWKRIAFSKNIKNSKKEDGGEILKIEDEITFEPLAYVDFLGIEEFFLSSPRKNIIFRFGTWDGDLILDYEMLDTILFQPD